jgi:hypothetical protein
METAGDRRGQLRGATATGKHPASCWEAATMTIIEIITVVSKQSGVRFGGRTPALTGTEANRSAATCPDVTVATS